MVSSATDADGTCTPPAAVNGSTGLANASASPSIEPSVTPTELAPRVDTSAVRELNGAVHDVAAAISGVTGSTVAPNVDESGAIAC